MLELLRRRNERLRGIRGCPSSAGRGRSRSTGASLTGGTLGCGRGAHLGGGSCYQLPGTPRPQEQVRRLAARVGRLEEQPPPATMMALPTSLTQRVADLEKIRERALAPLTTVGETS